MQSARGLLTQMHVKNLLNKNYAELQYTSTVQRILFLQFFVTSLVQFYFWNLWCGFRYIFWTLILHCIPVWNWNFKYCLIQIIKIRFYEKQALYNSMINVFSLLFSTVEPNAYVHLSFLCCRRTRILSSDKCVFNMWIRVLIRSRSSLNMQ